MLQHLPLLLTYALMIVVAREVWVRRQLPRRGRHRVGMALGIGYQQHTGVTADTPYIFKKESEDVQTDG